MYRNIAGLILLAGVVAGFVVSRNFEVIVLHGLIVPLRTFAFDGRKRLYDPNVAGGLFFRYGNVVIFSVQVQLSQEDFMGESKRNNEKFRGNFPDGYRLGMLMIKFKFINYTDVCNYMIR